MEAGHTLCHFAMTVATQPCLSRPSPSPRAPFCGFPSLFPLLTPSEMRTESLTFPPSTAASFDGTHMRHFAMLSDAGVATVALALVVMEEVAL